ncbi:MAG: cysteine--tRNA ligase [Firmicutes bacterium]|nr:cysteine--tRNA ligase [Bacillota bacterium]NPV30514.1 cysteine--tRNA ligase [Bacillota bacterium]
MSLRVYNTLTKQKEDFIPASPHQVKMYVCGPTTYDFIHLGNARALVVFDTIRRYLEYKGYRVLYVQNFTDIDDKIIARAAEENEDALELANRYIREYYRDADALRVLRADVHPRASEHIAEMIQMVERLLEKGMAYQVDGDVYFSIRQFPGYGKLSGRTLEEMRAGARVEVDARKRDPLDFVLWKAAKPGEPAWESPWGRGRPGWHLECSAMSLKYLGFGFDIHGGGSDLIFPHHENEIAQAEAYAGAAPFARYWIHNGFVTVNEEKMSKSLRNFFIVRDLLQEWPPEIVRFFLLSTHYRSPLDFNLEQLEQARRSYSRLRNTLELLEEVTGKQEVVPAGRLSREAVAFRSQIVARVEEFETAMDDDFNTALALAALHNLGRDVNGFINREDFNPTPAVIHVLVRVRQYFIRLLDLLGLVPGESRELGSEYYPALKEAAVGVLPEPLPATPQELLAELLKAREEARRQKNYQAADALRETLRKIGIILEDTPRGVRWRLV